MKAHTLILAIAATASLLLAPSIAANIPNDSAPDLPPMDPVCGIVYQEIGPAPDPYDSPALPVSGPVTTVTNSDRADIDASLYVLPPCPLPPPPPVVAPPVTPAITPRPPRPPRLPRPPKPPEPSKPKPKPKPPTSGGGSGGIGYCGASVAVCDAYDDTFGRAPEVGPGPKFWDDWLIDRGVDTESQEFQSAFEGGCWGNDCKVLKDRRKEEED